MKMPPLVVPVRSIAPLSAPAQDGSRVDTLGIRAESKMLGSKQKQNLCKAGFF
jgi:hypothetical protein